MPRSLGPWHHRLPVLRGSPSPVTLRRLLAAGGPLVRSKTLQYSALGFTFGLSLTCTGYLVDY